MAVAFDAKVTITADTTGATSLSTSTLTVGSGSNRALIAFVGFSQGSIPAGLSCTWDSGGSNQSMTQVASVVDGAGSHVIVIFGLVNPVSGAKVLRAAWTASLEAHLSAVSFTGVDQTGGVTSFPHANSATATSTSASVTITSATGNMVVAACEQDSFVFTSTNGTTIDLDTGSPGPQAAMASLYNNGAATVACTAAWGGGSVVNSIVGCDILAAGGGVTFPVGGPMYMV